MILLTLIMNLLKINVNLCITNNTLPIHFKNNELKVFKISLFYLKFTKIN